MKLYYSPLACSLAGHIALLEAGAEFEREQVNLKTKLTATGDRIADLTGKGYVPALVLDGGAIITENIAVLDWIAARYTDLGVSGPLGRTRLLEALSFISTEVHRSFKPYWHLSSHSEKAAASSAIEGQFGYFADRVLGSYLFGEKPSVADFYLFVMLLWANRFAVPIPAPLVALGDKIAAKPAAQAAMRFEGLLI